MAILLASFSTGKAYANRLDYSDTIAAFTGDLSEGKITGDVTLDTGRLSVDATIVGPSITGSFSAEGRRQGRFWAVIEGNKLSGHYDIEGRVGSWSIPLSRLPRDLRTSLQATTQ